MAPFLRITLKKNCKKQNVVVVCPDLSLGPCLGALHWATLRKSLWCRLSDNKNSSENNN